MKTTDRTIIVGIGLVALIAVFWFMVISPKREQAAELETDVSALEASVSEYEAAATAAEAAEESFDRNYHSLVVLGKAVPSDSDTSSLFVELNQLAADSKVQLDAIELNEATAAPPPPPPAEGSAPEEEPADSETVPVETPAAPVEAVAASLPLGATVGPAGLPVMPYKLSLDGSFFELADFLQSVDGLVGYEDAKPDVRGRLLTIDGFSLTPLKEPTTTTTGEEATGGPTGDLVAELAITSYVSPVDQGLRPAPHRPVRRLPARPRAHR